MEGQHKNIRQKLKDLGVSSDGIDDIELIIKFVAVVNNGKGAPVIYETDPYDIVVLYTLVRMAASHDAFQDLDELQKQAIERFKGFCRRIWNELGLTVDEVKRMEQLFLDEETLERGETCKKKQ